MVMLARGMSNCFTSSSFSMVQPQISRFAFEHVCCRYQVRTQQLGQDVGIPFVGLDPGRGHCLGPLGMEQNDALGVLF